VRGLIVEPLARQLTHIVVQGYTVPAVDHLVRSRGSPERHTSG
jgi:hypothetical protein